MADIQDFTLDIAQSMDIKAAVGDAWKVLLSRFTCENSTPDNKLMPMVLEEWPGGRWLRDLGNGHLWGFVQVIKPPSLIDPDHRAGVHHGWDVLLQSVKQLAEFAQ